MEIQFLLFMLLISLRYTQGLNYTSTIITLIKKTQTFLSLENDYPLEMIKEISILSEELPAFNQIFSDIVSMSDGRKVDSDKILAFQLIKNIHFQNHSLSQEDFFSLLINPYIPSIDTNDYYPILHDITRKITILYGNFQKLRVYDNRSAYFNPKLYLDNIAQFKHSCKVTYLSQLLSDIRTSIFDFCPILPQKNVTENTLIYTKNFEKLRKTDDRIRGLNVYSYVKNLYNKEKNHFESNEKHFSSNGVDEAKSLIKKNSDNSLNEMLNDKKFDCYLENKLHETKYLREDFLRLAANIAKYSFTLQLFSDACKEKRNWNEKERSFCCRNSGKVVKEVCNHLVNYAENTLASSWPIITEFWAKEVIEKFSQRGVSYYGGIASFYVKLFGRREEIIYSQDEFNLLHGLDVKAEYLKSIVDKIGNKKFSITRQHGRRIKLNKYFSYSHHVIIFEAYDYSTVQFFHAQCLPSECITFFLMNTRVFIYRHQNTQFNNTFLHKKWFNSNNQTMLDIIKSNIQQKTEAEILDKIQENVHNFTKYYANYLCYHQSTFFKINLTHGISGNTIANHPSYDHLFYEEQKNYFFQNNQKFECFFLI